MSLVEKVARAARASLWRAFDDNPDSQWTIEERRQELVFTERAIRATLEEAGRAASLHVDHPVAKGLMDAVYGLMLSRFEQGKPLAPDGEGMSPGTRAEVVEAAPSAAAIRATIAVLMHEAAEAGFVIGQGSIHSFMEERRAELAPEGPCDETPGSNA